MGPESSSRCAPRRTRARGARSRSPAWRTIAAADFTLRRRKPPWLVVGLFDHPAHLATAALIALGAPARPRAGGVGSWPGRCSPDVDHIPLALRDRRRPRPTTRAR